MSHMAEYLDQINTFHTVKIMKHLSYNFHDRSYHFLDMS